MAEAKKDVKTLHSLDDNAESLLQFLQEAKAAGVDLSVVYVENADGEQFVVAKLIEHTLTDGSKAHDIVLDRESED